jgi:hypothetical protein
VKTETLPFENLKRMLVLLCCIAAASLPATAAPSATFADPPWLTPLSRHALQPDSPNSQFPEPNGMVQQTELFSPAADPASEAFGEGIALSGNTLVVSAPPRAEDGGAVYVYVRSGEDWVLQARLLPGGGPSGLAFGVAVALDGDTLAIGQPARLGATGYPNAGGVLVYARVGDTWSLQADLQLENGNDNDLFGWSVALEGDALIIGKPQPAGSPTGAAYVYTRMGAVWTLQAELRADDPQASAAFGSGVAISGNQVLVGAAQWDSQDVGLDVGAVYAFTRSGDSWSSQGKLETPGVSPGALLGMTIALKGDTAIVGDRLHTTDAGPGAGLVYVYARNADGWHLHSVLEPDDAAEGQTFGSGVALTENAILISAPMGRSFQVDGSGAAYLFVRSQGQWLQQAKLQDESPARFRGFGSRVALTGETAAVLERPLDSSSSIHLYENVANPTRTVITHTEPSTIFQGGYYTVFVHVEAVNPNDGIPLGTVEVSDDRGNLCSIDLATANSCRMLASYAEPPPAYETLTQLQARYTPQGPVTYQVSMGSGTQIVMFVDSIFADGFD